MAQYELKFALERPARKSGGDRYVSRSPEHWEFVVYVPQTISREGGTTPAEKLVITFEPQS